jgi:hypothetical protein
MTTETDFVAGERYPMTEEEARKVMRHGWPAVRGTPDTGRGRRFLKAPCGWEFWTTDGRKVEFDLGPGGLVVSQSREPDPDRPPPLAEAARP